MQRRDLCHALRNYLDVFEGRSDLVMYVGPDLSGNLIEVGVSDDPRIVHGMPARPQFRPRTKW
ncbi:hypothetical protein Xcel_1603 [Xylanimonas cellulosilytica DSM 15894]|uniref:Uncharacterized protein n=1 Tax=Xylanimonas cellulosilytica (strain DSM 15894 / JCM 12276 / CECT 5975 / KCTC 9989 / LMG 20990 / NBRC 107835 / XIL07) TaxID=446471 RepID=D1BSD6_XYLCX|nr:hypothetical protein Xcel_1603 [Xylanimonas cellulosilytica DSM 15894]